MIDSFWGLRGNSVRPSVISNLLIVCKWGERGAIKNLVSRVSILVIVFNVLLINTSFANQSTKTYQLEYLKQLDANLDQYSCLTPLITMESRWNPAAKNGSHYGLPQGRSKYLATATPKEQITWHIKYLKHRYGTDRFGVANACGAWSHWLMKGWH